MYVYPEPRQRVGEPGRRDQLSVIKLKCARLKLWWKTRHARAAYRRLFNANRPRSRRPF
jgi:hypothetical protein